MPKKIHTSFWKKNYREGISILISIIAAGLGFSYLTIRTIQANSATYVPSRQPLCILYKPETIYFPKEQFTVKVRAGEIRGNEWTMYPDSASWFLNAQSGSCKGNTIIWGHNTSSVFAEMSKVKPGEIIELAGASGIKKYKVTLVKDTQSSDLSFVKTQEEQLTIYTCSGPFDINRHFVIAKIILD